MTQREKMILSVMAITIAFGIYSFWFQGGDGAGGSRSGIKSKPVDQFVAEVMKTLEKDDASILGPFVVERAATPWQRNPMMKLSQTIAADTTVAHETNAVAGYQRFVYSGYLAMGVRRLAIINGLEFEIGDPVTDDGYILRRITPSAIEIRRTGRDAAIVVKREGQE